MRKRRIIPLLVARWSSPLPGPILFLGVFEASRGKADRYAASQVASACAPARLTAMAALWQG